MERSVSVKLIERVAAEKGVEAVSLDPPLYTVISPEALNSLFAETESDPRSEGKVEFEYAGYDVTVYADGEIELSEISSGVKSGASMDSSTTGTVD